MPEVGESDERPWGYWRTVDAGAGYQVKRLVVRAGARLSLQSHRRRREFWVVVSGEARVLVAGVERVLRVGEHVEIGVGEAHRLANDGDADLVVCEVQLGDYLGEDDIERYADDYGRG
ncbi:MAG: phosphomannose isomerase type II C-terminal cupin domain [Alphaproteobacteria bacterium]|nr:phosphomannose isomerase type II C-terminal cupin domain [Alphaproteobacteria bacterium]MDA7988076.1 phosphomannose isomerase type II C-terminal cupin domain [Alphaproteobacteria bacterium]MDA8004382.1 phosphomannose isomerase type II C-terminal cupin domain [Alphaproteobacteria bacterium]MDA8009110.1 phosphomannose isomerase type II C-terminal cupin domain [Alphaproteobacteria bacterium]MDA8012406.1 phosphomannose isomerase type II C-terminal cupin domain [Alphaproteobacteria bacterium]